MTKSQEFAAIIIDEFEGLLADKNIYIPSAERQDYLIGIEESDEAHIYGTEYYTLEDGISDIIGEKFRKIRDDLIALCEDNIVIAKEIQEYFEFYLEEN